MARGSAVSRPAAWRQGRQQRLGSLFDLDNLIGHQPVRLAVHALCRLLVRGFDQAKDLTGVFVIPVLDVIHPVLFVHREIRLVGLSSRVGCQALNVMMNIDEERHRSFVPRPEERALTLDVQLLILWGG
jgi:hypothetical protein